MRWFIVVGVLALLVGVLASWMISRALRPPQTTETALPEIRHTPQVLTAARVPVAIRPATPHGLPGRVVRRLEASIQQGADTPVDVVVIQTADEDGTRTTIETDQGQVISATDFVYPAMRKTDFRWTALVLARRKHTGERDYGAGISYRYGRVSAFGAIFRDEQIIGAGFSW